MTPDERNDRSMEIVRSLSAIVVAAQAVVDRWDTALWKDMPATAIYIEKLRKELDRLAL